MLFSDIDKWVKTLNLEIKCYKVLIWFFVQTEFHFSDIYTNNLSQGFTAKIHRTKKNDSKN